MTEQLSHVISEGTVAPEFALPAVVDDVRRRVALDEYLGDDVVILAFYPADFNPACDEISCDLDELDLFTMQKDVTILGISPDSVYSHRKFADTYDLKVPLLADTDHEVAREYGVDFVDEIGQRLIERGVVVVDHDGVVQYSWSTTDLTELPRVDEIKDAIADTGGDDTAFARYRVGHAHYTEGRRAFTAAMGEFENSEWMVAQSDFRRACEAFTEAADHFDTAVRFVDDESVKPIYDGAKTKANSLWQAADWLTQAASAYSSGSGAEGQELREDAERPLETARTYEEPPDPDGPWPPDIDDLEREETETSSILPNGEEKADAALDVDIDDEVEADDSGAATDEDSSTAPESVETVDGESEETAAEEQAPVGSVTQRRRPTDGEDIDDAEIEEIQAELEASQPEAEPTAAEVTEESTAMVEEPPDSVGEADGSETDTETETPTAAPDDTTTASERPEGETGTDRDVDLELTDPTDGEEAAESDDGAAE